jgi:Na+/H+ antiporter NhaD/arsenite permease-like protein
MDPTQLAPNPWMITPFVALLGAIALGPLFASDWWGRHYPKVSFGLGSVTLAYYCLGLGRPAEIGHVALEYFSFIALVGSLYVVSGGIHIGIKGESTPLENVLFLLFGAVIANLLGTTGASMLLIRPWIRANRYRITAHHVVFFIFIVSNVGGCLTPIGDPPLFLGYLKGVPFGWVMQACWPAWLTGVGLLLAIFYVVDRRNYLRAPRQVREALAEPRDAWKFEGVANVFFLGLILAAVFLERPKFLRELVMVAAAAGSYFTTRRSIHQANDFNFHPIQEVAILFAGIFSTMMPALDWLEANASRLGHPDPGLFYWGSGALSSVLDNAPTYLSFLSALIGGSAGEEAVAAARATFAAGLSPEHAQIAVILHNPSLAHVLLAISIGSVFFGANTYIGNGPNFMVKAIAEQQRVRMPSFLGYILRFTLPVMLPVLLIVWALFFRS